MNSYPEFAKLLEYGLEQKARSQSWLAHRLGLQPSAVNRWINQLLRPDSPETVVRIADLLGIDRQQLLIAANYGYQEVVADEDDISTRAHSTVVFGAPPPPPLLIGRHRNIDDLYQLLTSESSMTLLTAVRGWPGVGKTTLAVALAHEPRLRVAFPDGILWTALGENPSVLQSLGEWLLALKDNPQLYPTPESRTNRLRTLLQGLKMLLVIDDVWDAATTEMFRIGGRHCRTLITTRESGVARNLGISDRAIYVLPVLSDAEALDLLSQLAPTAVQMDRDGTLQLIQILEGLPLALQVAGRLLAEEAAMGWGIENLLQELLEGTKLMEADAPSDRADLTAQTTSSVSLLFRKSTDRLDATTRKQFALLGTFVPKPATFDIAAVQALWEVDNPQPTLRMLVRRGLLEPNLGSRFQMHSLLRIHARTLLTEAT